MDTNRTSKAMQLVAVSIAAALLAGCSSPSARMNSGSTYTLAPSGWQTEAQVQEPAALNAAEEQQDAAYPAPEARQHDDGSRYVYRGGRDPVTGRASSPAQPRG